MKEDGPRIPLPRPPQVRIVRAKHPGKAGCSHDPGTLDRNAGVLKWVDPALGRDHVGLAPKGLSYVNDATLEYRGRVAEYEVYCAVNVAHFEELALR